MMLKFSSMAPELERVNELGYRLPLNDTEIKRMQSLNRGWASWRSVRRGWNSWSRQRRA